MANLSGIKNLKISVSETTPSTPKIGDIWISSGNQFQCNADNVWMDPFTDLMYHKSGTLWMWGYNPFGELGLNHTSNVASPEQIGTATTWYAIQSNLYHSLGIKTDGTLWAWGYSNFGQLGAGERIARSSPVQIGSLTTWSNITTGYYQSFGIKTDGALCTWGYNAYGQLGLGDIISRSSPVQVGTMTIWSQIASKYYHTLARRTDGTLWTWGYNPYGELGHNDRINRSSPVQVGALTTWSYIDSGQDYNLAIKTDGTLWAWGYNGQGQLGQNGISSGRSSPVQVGIDTNWAKVTCGNAHSLGIKTDGTLWSWGLNSNGQLGLGETISRSSPTQVGLSTNWVDICATVDNTSVARKMDGTLWAWGLNSSGQLGQSNTISRSSPVQIGSSTKWLYVNAQGNSVIAVQN